MNDTTKNRSKKRVLVADDHPVTIVGLRSLIGKEQDLTVSASVGSLEEVLAAVRSKDCPDVVLMDLSLGGSNGIDLIKNIKLTHPRLPVLVLSMRDEDLYVGQVLRSGGSGYITKTEDPSRIIQGLRKALAGEIFISEKMEKKLMTTLVGGRNVIESAPSEVLSARELEIFSMLGGGQSTRQIATLLGINIRTVGSHRTRIRTKLQLPNAAALVRHAVEWRTAANGNL